MAINTDRRRVRPYLDGDNRFIVEDYNWAKPFSNFLPGIGGEWGIPMWVFYVNRVQCISSMGIRDKNDAILEFHSFNRALQLVAHYGFRTFLKIDKRLLYEPFQRNKDKSIRQTMLVCSEETEIKDINSKLGIETTVRYFPLVNEPIAALVREMRLKNLNTKPIEIELLDGLPSMLPYGLNQNLVKFTPWHVQGMMEVNQLIGVPLYRLKQTPDDVSQIGEICGGNFYFSSMEGGNRILAGHFIVDPHLVFGESEAYDYPWHFESYTVDELLSLKQIQENKTPCAFTALAIELPASGEIVLYSLVGNTQDDASLCAVLDSVNNSDFFALKRRENKETIARIKNHTFTVSSSEKFDQYCQQTFLDNTLRGGIPTVFHTREGKSAMYSYSRKHGDLERDYNFFTMEPTYLSQGDGFYRDVNQNRRNDVWFFPKIEDINILTFMNLLQADGYNPQVVTKTTYTADGSLELARWLRSLVNDNRSYQMLLQIVSRPFTPGEFIMKLEQQIGRDVSKYHEILKNLLLFCRENNVGDLHEGFWVDHWTYNLDLIERFLEIYPERLKEVLVNRKIYLFYDNLDVVLPRDSKYVMVDGKIRQYGAVVHDPQKLEMLRSRSEMSTRARANHGAGPAYRTNLLVKLLSVVANKIATLDPQGIGIMMEADKPGWCDPLNGLPGLFGSSICETMELERLCRFLRTSLDEIKLNDDDPLALYEELYQFLQSLSKSMDKRLKSSEKSRTFTYWDESNRLKEDYWKRTKMGVSGSEIEMPISQVKIFLDTGLMLLSEAFGPQNEAKLFDNSGVCYTYFVNEVVECCQIWKESPDKIPATNHEGYPLVTASRFESWPLPIFLEGPVHLLRVHPEKSKHIYQAVKVSQLYDNDLKMYRNCDSLEKAPFDVGRIRAYPSGWIENGSVYLHMEYKWLLELLRSGLHHEFYRDMKSTLVPFLDPEVYGRSTLEGSSFIVSSAFPDEKLHGRGFQPRLSGCTCEMLHIWTIMVAGTKTFFVNENGRLMLRLHPILPGWLFTRRNRTCQYHDKNGTVRPVVIPKNSLAFKFIGRVLVLYHNEERRDTFGESGAGVVSYELTYEGGKRINVSGEVMETALALDVREGRVERIDVVLS